MGASEVEAFLSYLAVDREVAASTQNQAFSAPFILENRPLRHFQDYFIIEKPDTSPQLIMSVFWVKLRNPGHADQ